MKTYIIQLDQHDDIISIRDKVSWSKGHRVLLVWPRKGRVLERRVDLMLVQRHCHQMGMQLALVTRSRPAREVARDLGIPVFTSTLRAQGMAWRRPRLRKRFQWPEDRKPLPADALRAQHGQLRARLLWNRWIRASIFLVGILAFLALVFFFMPGARVELSPARQQQALTIGVWANASIQAPNLSGGVPAYPASVVVEGREQAPSSGRTYIPDRTSTGEIELTNLTDQPVVVPAGSVVFTVGDDPVRFVTTRPVELPAGPGEKTAVLIRAALPGSEANVRAGEIQAMEGALGLRVSVHNPERTSGGSLRILSAPSDQDYEDLRARLLDQLRQNALEELQAQMQPGQRLLEGSLREKSILTEDRIPGAGEPSDQLQLMLQVEYEAWTVKDSDLGMVGAAALDANLPAGFRADPGTLQVRFAGKPVFDGAGSARWQVELERSLVAGWSKDRVIQLVQGRTAQEAAEALQAFLPLDRAPRLEMFPAWWVRLPFLPFRIEVLES